MSSFPEEIYFEILLKVPLKSLLTCKCVCKTWFSLIICPDFAKKHLNLTVQRNKPNLLLKGYENNGGNGNLNLFYSIGHDSLDLLLSETDRFVDYAVEIDYPFKSFGYVEIMGCCDGLVCLWYSNRQLFCLWNPATRECWLSPKSNLKHVTMVAFGCDYVINDYKLLACDLESSFEICSLRSNSWKIIENIGYKFQFFSKASGVLCNGDFHWLAERKDSTKFILSLDIRNEIFKEMELPNQPLGEVSWFRNLGVLEGLLCVISLNDALYVEVWVMQKYGIRESWTKRYSVKDERIIDDPSLRIIWSFQSGEILLGGACCGLLLYFPGRNILIRPNMSSSTYLFQEAHYFESLVSLKSDTSDVRKRIKDVPRLARKLSSVELSLNQDETENSE